MLRATAEANNLSALASAQEKYVENMDKVRIVLFSLLLNILSVNRYKSVARFTAYIMRFYTLF